MPESAIYGGLAPVPLNANAAKSELAYGLAAHVAQAVKEGTAAAACTSDPTALSDEALDALILPRQNHE